MVYAVIFIFALYYGLSRRWAAEEAGKLVASGISNPSKLRDHVSLYVGKKLVIHFSLLAIATSAFGGVPWYESLGAYAVLLVFTLGLAIRGYRKGVSEVLGDRAVTLKCPACGYSGEMKYADLKGCVEVSCPTCQKPFQVQPQLEALKNT